MLKVFKKKSFPWLAGSVAIQISPINDEPFQLQKRSTNVVRFQKKVLTAQDLLTTDPDTAPQHIHYQIMTGPPNGKIVIENRCFMIINLLLYNYLIVIMLCLH